MSDRKLELQSLRSLISKFIFLMIRLGTRLSTKYRRTPLFQNVGHYLTVQLFETVGHNLGVQVKSFDK